MDNKAFIDDMAVKRLCMDVMQYVENIKKALDRYNDLVDDIKTYYNDNTYQYVLNKKNNFNIYRNISINNLMSYVDDYNYVLNKFKNYDASFAINTNFDNIDV